MTVINPKRFLFLKVYTILALVSLLVASLAPHAAQAQAATCVEEIVMQRGQTLATIAARVYGTQDAVTNIMAATNAQAARDASFTTIRDPNAVEAGWKICIPAASDDEDAIVGRRASTNGATSTRITSPKGKSETGDVALERNDSLMASLLAARLSEDGVHPLSIEYLRRQEYPGSPLTIEATLPGGGNYRQYLVSYQSEGLTLYAAMTVPTGETPTRGWPVVIFVHGYIKPSLYSPTERYIEYVDAIASNGYIVLRPDLRGHGDSEGAAYGAYGDPGYTIDLLNALASIQQYPDADPDGIGVWGHSMGGYITARAMVVSNEIKAGVIWGGVVAPYAELVAEWGKGTSAIDEGELPIDRVLVDSYGTPQENAGFWETLSANSYASDLSGPVQLHHGTADAEVPVAFSDLYYTDLIAAGQVAEYYLYPGDDHNISASFEIAMRRSLEFLDTYVKNVSLRLVQVPGSSSAQLIP